MQQNTEDIACLDVEKKRIKKYLLLLLGAFACYILFVCLNEIVGSNIVFSGTMLYELTEWVYLAIELLAFFIAYAYAIYILFERGYRAALRYAGIYAAATGARHVVLHLLNWLFFGLRAEDMLFQALMTSIEFLLELVQYAAIFVIAFMLTHRFNLRIDIMKQGAAQLQKVTVERETLVFPYRKMPLLNDPLRGSALLSAILISVIRVANRMVYDSSYGAPIDTGDLLWMILYYTVDILIGVACYFVLLFIIRRLSLSGKKVDESTVM